MEQNGLQNVTYEYNVSRLGTVGSARGYKRLSGRWVTYETQWYVGRRSILSLSVGGPSESYPRRQVVDFLASVAR